MDVSYNCFTEKLHFSYVNVKFKSAETWIENILIC